MDERYEQKLRFEPRSMEGVLGSSGLRSFTINPKVCVIYDLTDFGVLFCGICKAGRLCITQNVWIWTIFFSKLMCKNLSLALAGF